jgi:dienelactone hydrolase
VVKCALRQALWSAWNKVTRATDQPGQPPVMQGSGLSDGDWVTLGAHEVDDIAAAVEHLRVMGQTTTIGLWGRSMGAVTAMAYARQDPSISGIVSVQGLGNSMLIELTAIHTAAPSQVQIIRPA